MKKIILLMLFIILLSCWGTDQGEGKHYKYTIQNESGVNIVIKSYLPNLPNSSPIIIELNDGEELTKTYQSGLPPRKYDFATFFGNINAPRDSLKVIYNNLKVDFLIGECSQNERNPLNGCIYNGTDVTFTFTQQDYENAQPCNGNCD